jgi:hypothetical protein
MAGDHELGRLGREWLRTTPPDRESWGHVWEALWKVTPGDGDLEELGRHWLPAAPTENRSWELVWLPLAETYPEDTELRVLGLTWLSRAMENANAAWATVWEVLWKNTRGKEELTRLAQRWLQITPPDRAERILVTQGLSA